MDLEKDANSRIDDIIVVNTNDNTFNTSMDTKLIKDDRQSSLINPDTEQSKQNNKQKRNSDIIFPSHNHLTLYKRLNFFFLLTIIPIILLICIVVRPSFQSLIHLFCLFFLPFLYPINEKNSTGRLKHILICLIVLSFLSLTAQFIFQIVLVSSSADILPNCSFKEEILQEFGFSRFDNALISDVFRIIIPDVTLFIFCIIAFSINKKYINCTIEIKRHFLYKYPNQSTKDTTFTDHFCPLKNINEQAVTSPNLSNKQTAESFNQFFQKHKKRSKAIVRLYKLILTYVNQIVFLCLLFSCATILPSILTIPYFLAFIFLTTKWSITGQLKGTKLQFYIKIILIIYTALHILTLFLYQIKLFQEFFPSDDFGTRLIGLNRIVFTGCTRKAHFEFDPNLNWLQITQPFLLVLLYWLLSVELSYGLEKLERNNQTILGFSPEINIDKANESDNEKNSDLEENVTEKQKLFVNDVSTDQPSTSATMKLKKFSSVTTQSVATTSDLSSNTRKRHKDNLKRRRQTAVLFDYTRAYLTSLFKFLNKQSYLLSLVSMMSWSILYHSILTLVLLLWACLIWILPKSRQWCLRTSPLLVFYSKSLLILEFVYGLKLNSSELPEFKEIGLVKHEIPFAHLAIKAGLCLSFLLTLHQYLTEKREATVLRIPAEEPIILDTSTQSNYPNVSNNILFLDQKSQAEILEWLQSIFAKYWIFLSSLMLLLMSCQNEVVAYRIGYMGLFLYFITTFQLLNSFWRISLYTFNFIVIIYSMIVLVLIYLFQFDDVPEYFKRVLNIDDSVLSSIGFEKFGKKDELVVKLLTPTAFLIVNIIQNHYFHEPWMKLTDTKNVQQAEPVEAATSINHDNILISHLQVDIMQKSEEELKRGRKRENFLTFVKRMLKNTNKLYSEVSVYVWRFAEIHVYKILVCLIGIYCLKKITLINLILFVSILLGIIADHRNAYDNKIRTIYSGVVQIWVSILAISSMLFQLKFVQSPLVTNCTVS
ncbi:unnamed protein product [Brachionus calyciflorus]|uniref:Piezo TM1-24 domain-containing protein n=1 Tax=Brachionus calyciflorus TaxID=104777 RepID=A0A813RPE4_9BILA|nr:unnamed protein product [Brachionus calyciflorus]